MELLDLMVEVERYVSLKGLKHSDTISELINAMAEDVAEEE